MLRLLRYLLLILWVLNRVLWFVKCCSLLHFIILDRNDSVYLLNLNLFWGPLLLIFTNFFIFSFTYLTEQFLLVQFLILFRRFLKFNDLAFFMTFNFRWYLLLEALLWFACIEFETRLWMLTLPLNFIWLDPRCRHREAYHFILVLVWDNRREHGVPKSAQRRFIAFHYGSESLHGLLVAQHLVNRVPYTFLVLLQIILQALTLVLYILRIFLLHLVSLCRSWFGWIRWVCFLLYLLNLNWSKRCKRLLPHN